MVKFFLVLSCLPLFLCGIESDAVFKYLAASPVMVGYADLAAIRGSWLEADLRRLNAGLSAAADGAYDFSGDFAEFSSVAVAAYEPFHPKNQRLLLRTAMEPEDFFSMLERASGVALRRTNVGEMAAAVFPPESVNRNFRGSFEPSAIYFEPGVCFVGDLTSGSGILSGVAGSSLVPVEFSGAPADAFLAVAVAPARIPAAAAFTRGVDSVLLTARFSTADAVEAAGNVVCSDEKTASRLAVNLQIFAVTMLPVLMPDDGDLAMLTAASLKVAAAGSRVNVSWTCTRDLAGRIIGYYTAARPASVAGRRQ
ncbi:MAG: hypothetical protein PHI85_07795 [Victivallaceae bacterium]|nr:hypothetical protein [Victivallaceae bacterium]